MTPRAPGCEAVADTAMADPSGPGLFDTSPMYGRAEGLLADCLSERRDDALVATKVWSRTRAVGEQQIDRALDWFERVDIYQVHNLLAKDDFLPYLHHLKAGGRVRAVGASHYLPSSFPQLLALMRRREIDTVQVPYHPLERTVEADLLPEAERLGIGVIVMTPLATGNLLKREPSAAELAPLAEFGVHTWAQALLKWGTQRCSGAYGDSGHSAGRAYAREHGRRPRTLVHRRRTLVRAPSGQPIGAVAGATGYPDRARWSR